MSVIEKIYKYIDFKRISVNEFSKKVAVSNGYFAKQRAANGAVSSHIIEKIVIAYPELNLDWLFKDEGEIEKNTHKFNSDNNLKNTHQHKYISALEASIEDKEKLIKLMEEKIDHLERKKS